MFIHNVYNPGHMTKMAAIAIYGKALQDTSSTEFLDQFQRNLACNIWE